MLECMNESFWILDVNNIYVNPHTQQETAFSDIQQDELFALEEDSWWFEYRANVICKMLNLFVDKKKMLVDVGGGNGYTTQIAKKCGYNVALVEPTYKACMNANNRGLGDVYCGTVDEQSVKDHSADTFMLLDVLEHIEDDEKFLMLLHKKLKVGGKVIVTVPAFQSLWSSEDDAAGHFRRYRIQEIKHLFSNCGFRIEFASYFMGFLYLPILMIRVWLEKIGVLKKQGERTQKEREQIAQNQFKKRHGIINVVLMLLENRELKVLSKLKDKKIKFGSSIILIASSK